VAALAGVGVLLALLLASVLSLGGYDVSHALRAMIRGALGSRDAVLSFTFVRSIPLMLTGLAVAIAFRGGVLNIGAEGQLIAGATGAAAVALHGEGVLGPLLLPASLLGAALSGAAWTVVPAWLRRRFGILEVISTIMMNFLAADFVSFLVRGPMQEPSRIYPQSLSLAESARLPVILANSRLHAGFVIALVVALLLWILETRSVVGFRVRAVGANPTAARSAGRIDAAATSSWVFLLSGALAGLAGGIEVTGVTFALYENISGGYGYTAIAVALLGGLRPLWIIPSAIFFGGLEAGATAMQRDAGVPAGFVAFIEAVIILAVLAWQAVAPRLDIVMGRPARITLTPRGS
jgi:simple sugar transport system permease protein